MPLIVTLDACVLYPPGLRDLLIRLALQNVFVATWSEDILAEMVHAVVSRRQDISQARMERTVAHMKSALPSASVKNYEQHMDNVHLPDRNDRHVLAVAIEGGAQKIITENIADFPAGELRPYNITAEKSDDFLCGLLDVNAEHVLTAIQNQSAALNKPPKTVADIVDGLQKSGLGKSAKRLRWLLGLPTESS